MFFQSHFGLILSPLNIHTNPNGLLAFNPILVWFYHLRKKLEAKRKELAFNPTMVWFYLLKKRYNDVRWQSFQSHYGLILSVNYINRLFHKLILSIPLWSDFIEMVRLLRKKIFLNFQSHYGLILSRNISISSPKSVNFQSHYGLILSFRFRLDYFTEL